MYNCIMCGMSGEKPVSAYNKDGDQADACGYCKSDKIRISDVNCSLCGAALYHGEYAYEAGEMLICENCLTRVLV